MGAHRGRHAITRLLRRDLRRVLGDRFRKGSKKGSQKVSLDADGGNSALVIGF